MPVVFFQDGFKFFFFSNEGDPREPIHIHVRKDAKLAKFWLRPAVRLDDSYGFSARELPKSRKLLIIGKRRSRKPGMTILNLEALAADVSFDADNMWVELTDGRQLGVPLAYFPRLANASSAQRRKYVISGGGVGLHWDDLDEDISVPALLAGKVDRTAKTTSKIKKAA